MTHPTPDSPPPMVPSASERVTEHEHIFQAVYYVAPGNAVRLVEEAYRDGWKAALAAQQSETERCVTVEQRAKSGSGDSGGTTTPAGGFLLATAGSNCKTAPPQPDDADCIERIAAALYEDMYNRSWARLEEWAKPQWRKMAKTASDAARAPEAAYDGNVDIQDVCPGWPDQRRNQNKFKSAVRIECGLSLDAAPALMWWSLRGLNR